MSANILIFTICNIGVFPNPFLLMVDWLLLSSLYLARGEVRKATEHVQKILRVDLENPEVLKIIESMQENQNAFSKWG